MCLAIPAKIIHLLDQQSAIVQVGGIEKKISTALVENIAVNDYVIIHVGFALTKLDEVEAEKTLVIFKELQNEIY
jgi:hydrogenase expression/formation protein HypC